MHQDADAARRAPRSSLHPDEHVREVADSAGTIHTGSLTVCCMPHVLVRPFRDNDEARVIELWTFAGLVRPWNDPRKDIARKLQVQRDLFLVAELDGVVVGVVMAGYEGHRGWINYLAADIGQRRRGIGSALMLDAERRLRLVGCPKINLQVRRENAEVQAFYASLGFTEDAVVSLGKRLEDDKK
jgi:ribosomal protein S18 acetylase RimI-like enzyme